MIFLFLVNNKVLLLTKNKKIINIFYFNVLKQKKDPSVFENTNALFVANILATNMADVCF